MRTLLARYGALFAPEDGSGSGGTPGGGQDNASPPAGAGGDGAAPPATPPADQGAAPPAATGPYRPQGLPETMFGKDDRETIDKMGQALNGYRQKDAARDVPADPAGYLNLDGLKNFQLDDAYKPYFDALKDDPSATAMFDALHKGGVGREVALQAWQAGIKAMSEAGLLEAPLDVAAERGKLLPDAARNLPKDQQDAAIDARMQANEDFIKLMTTQGLDKDAAEYAQLMLMDSANGNKFFEFVAGKLMGTDRANPMAGQGGQAGSADSRRAQLRAEMAKPEMQPSHPNFDRAKHDALDAEYQKLFPEK